MLAVSKLIMISEFIFLNKRLFSSSAKLERVEENGRKLTHALFFPTILSLSLLYLSSTLSLSLSLTHTHTHTHTFTNETERETRNKNRLPYLVTKIS